MKNALAAFIEQRAVIDVVRQVVREELATPKARRVHRSRAVPA